MGLCRQPCRQNEAREIRTPNLLIWSQTRYRCAIAPIDVKCISIALHKQTLHSICQEVLNVLGSLKYHILSHACIARHAPHRASCAASEESNIIRADVDHVERTCANICSLRGMLPCTCFILCFGGTPQPSIPSRSLLLPFRNRLSVMRRACPGLKIRWK